MEQFRQDLYNDCLLADLPIISRDTAAKILAIVGLQGGDERIVLSPKCQCDLKYIQERFHIQGGETPDIVVARLMKRYTKELKEYTDAHNGEWTDWAYKLFQERYGFRLYNL